MGLEKSEEIGTVPASIRQVSGISSCKAAYLRVWCFEARPLHVESGLDEDALVTRAIRPYDSRLVIESVF